MGFAWSSFVCQATSVAVCGTGGLQEEDLLADDLGAPADTGRAAAVATDDIVVFTNRSQADAIDFGRSLDRSMTHHGITNKLQKGR